MINRQMQHIGDSNAVLQSANRNITCLQCVTAALQHYIRATLVHVLRVHCGVSTIIAKIT